MYESETKNKPFVLIARIHVKPGNIDQYLEIAAKVDAEVENSEPGMLFHNFDADPSDPLSLFRRMGNLRPPETG